MHLNFKTHNPRDKYHKEVGNDSFSSVNYARAYKSRKFSLPNSECIMK